MMMQNDSCRRAAALLLTLLLALPALALAGAPPAEGEVHGTVGVGGHVSDVQDEVGRVREYDLSRETFEPELWFKLHGWTGTNRLEALLRYQDEKTVDARARFEAGPWVDARFDHRSLIHWLDHDRLENLQWRELAGFNEDGSDKPGGKMITFEDTDPFGRYSLRHAVTSQRVDIALPVLHNTELSAGWRMQTREGVRQIQGVDHCSNCHVRSHPEEVDEETRDLDLRLSTEIHRLTVAYRFLARDYVNMSDAVLNTYMEARHPVRGDAQAEFGSRLIYSNAELALNTAPDVEKRGHSLSASVDLPKANTVRGAFSTATVENLGTKLQVTSNAASLGWFAPLAKRVRATASLTRRDVENDPVDVALPNWREGRPGGGQDFDYTRHSSYDREEYLGNAALVYAVKPGHTLRVDHRLQSTDRDHFQLDPDDPSETRTLRNRIRAAWNGRLSPNARSRASVEYEITDLPFVAVHGICEEGIGEEAVPIGDGQPNDWIYYFQRERFGTGANLPTKALRLKTNLSRRFGPMVSATVYANFADEKNDDLNVYDFERTVLNGGLSATVFPGTWGALSGGVAYSRIESNAKFCATVMDG